MSSVNGRMETCDRCGKSEFLKCIGEGEADGGYTRWNKFEEAKGWTYERKIGDLCPECSEEFKKLKEDFAKAKEDFKKGGVERAID